MVSKQFCETLCTFVACWYQAENCVQLSTDENIKPGGIKKCAHALSGISLTFERVMETRSTGACITLQKASNFFVGISIF